MKTSYQWPDFSVIP